MFLRFALFFAINILIVVSLSILTSILGIQPYLTSNGLDYGNLLAFCLVWGMGGAFISLLLSRVMARWMMGVQLVDTQRPGEHAWLLNKVYELCKKAGIGTMPQVGVYPGAELNAFATGPTKNRALVAVSSGLLERMNQNEIEGVLAHEVAHIQNGDMVTMTLVQGVINAMIMFFARVLGFAASQGVKEESRPLVMMIVTIVLEIALGLLGMIAAGWFSRRREFAADKGGAHLAGKSSMVAALEKLRKAYDVGLLDNQHQSLATLKISGKSSSWLSLFSTHPPLEQRIEALQRL